MVDADTIKNIARAIRAKDKARFEQLISNDQAKLDVGSMFGSWLHVACDGGSLEIVRLLVEKGFDINATNGDEERPPLLLAVYSGVPEVVEYLLSKGARFDLTKAEFNPLFAAIRSDRKQIAEILIKHGIDTTVKYRGASGEIKDALSSARDWGSKEIAEMIERANAAVGENPSIATKRQAAASVPQFTQATLLETATREGIEAFSAAIAKYPDEQFYAIVFYVDNDITSAYPHAQTVENLQRIDTSADPNYYKWAPAEWKLEFGQYYDSDLMRETCALLQSKGDGGENGFGELKRQTLATLAEALMRIRDSGIFAGHADVKRLAVWPHVGDSCGEEEWMFAPVIKHLPADVVEELRALFDFKVRC